MAVATTTTLAPAREWQHPILSRRGPLLLYLLAWNLPGLLLGYLLVASGYAAWQAAVLAVPLTVVYAFACLPVWYTCRVLPLQRDAVNALGAQIATAVLGGLLWMLLARLLAFTYGWPQPLHASRIVVWATGVLFYLLTAAAYYLVLERERATTADHRSREAATLAREAELRALKAQINPHFLYNSLNSISALTALDAARAREMCVNLGDFFRRTLALGASGEHSLVPLADELALLDRYLAIEQVRFGRRLQWQPHIVPEALAAPVPPLLLQPLVENAIVHGIASLPEGGAIVLEATVHDRILRLLLRNPFDPGEAERGNGMGLTNTRARLRALFPGRAQIETRTASATFEVAITLPLEEN